jgi:hypothetical protein
MGWRDVTYMTAVTFKVMVTKSERGRQLGRPENKKANKIEMNLKEIEHVWATFT